MKVRDRLLLATLAGTAGNLAALAVDTTTKRLKLNNWSWAERGKSLVVSKEYRQTSTANLSGLLVQEAISVLGAIPLVYAHSLTGPDKSPLKGALYGALTWLAIYGLGQRMVGSFKSTPSAAISNLISNITYGTVTALTITTLGDESLFRGDKVYENSPRTHSAEADDEQQDSAQWNLGNKMADEGYVH